MAALLLAAVVLSGCPSRDDSAARPATAEERNASIVAIADQFAATQDLEAAQVALSALDLPAAPQAVLALAESFIATGQDTETTLELANLAKGLGMSSRMVGDFVAAAAAGGADVPVALAPPATNTPVPTDTPQPTATPTDPPAPTDTPTEVPEPSDTPTATPVPRPVAVVDSQMNVRGGPGTVYPVVDQVQAGDELEIIARSQDDQWWQVTLASGNPGWLAASLVTASGPTDAVQVAQNVAPPPTARPTNTPAAPPPAAPPTDTPQPQPNVAPGMQYVATSVRVRPLGQDAQQCGGGEHNIFVLVTDQAGNPIDGVRIREIFTGNIRVSGDKGPGRADFDIYMNGGGQLQIVDGADNPISELTIGMPANLPPWDLFSAAGYCSCKPYPDLESCRAGWEARDFRYMPNTHYVYDVVFQRVG
ncbi:MAG: SH3 domain-containing protein [Caldilineales bacterium]